MRFARAQHRVVNDDEGVALILALIFVLVMALTVTALLPYTSTGLSASTAVRDVRSIQNAADGAVDQAINSIRGSFLLGASPACTGAGPFPVYSAPDFADPAPGTGVTKVQVEYCNDATSTPPPDQPPYALQTLTGGIDVDGNAPLVVAGGILASGKVSVKGTMQSVNVQGDLFATGDCEAKSLLFVSGVERCANTTPAYKPPPALNADPDPSSDPLSSIVDPALPTVVDPLGACPIGGAVDSVVTFSPGLYTESPFPDPVACTGAKHTVWWFTPGNYYFDFPDSTFTSVNGRYPDTAAEFSAQNITIVGGTPANWNPTTSVSSNVEDLFIKDPNHTKPACDEGSPGAVFAFGGPSSISVGTGATSPNHAEICSGDVGTQHLSFFGVRDGTSRTSIAASTLGVPAAASPVGSTTYAPPDAVRAIDGTAAVATVTGAVAGIHSATTTVGSFSGLFPAVIPEGSIITSAQLRINHWTEGTVGGATAADKVVPSIIYQSDGYTTPTKKDLTHTQAQPPISAGDVVLLPLTTSPGTPGWRALKKSLSNLTVQFTADGSALSDVNKKTPAEVAVSHLDGIQLEVGFIAPKVERTRCIPSGTAPCNLVTNKVDDALFPHGTVYAPRSVIEATVHGYSSTVFERGVIAAALIVHVSASAKQTLPPFQLPLGPKLRVVRFTAKVSTDGGTTWKDRLVALVQYDDFLNRPGGKTTAAPGHTVTVLRWTVKR